MYLIVPIVGVCAMRNPLRYERQLMHTNRRGGFSRRNYARTKLQCRVLTGPFLLLIGILWLSRSRDGHIGIHEIDKSRMEETESSEVDALRIREELVQSAEDGGDADTLDTSISNITEEDRETENEIMSSEGEALDEADDELCDRSKYPAEAELQSDKITILVNGFFESRLSLLQTHAQMYSTIPFVHSIYILWGNTSTPIDFLDQWTFTSYGVPIYVVRQDSTSLNARFLPRDYIKTRAVMICDDDITVDGRSLGFALDVWREDESRIVGFFPRAHAYNSETNSWMYVKHQNSYSIMLTKLMILATEYLYLYTCEIPPGVKEYVDGGMNCEDIAMNFLASDRSGKGPVLVEGRARDWGDPRNSAVREFHESALSARTNHHLNDRGDCITAFAKLWNGMKLRSSYSKASSDLENEHRCDKFGYLIDCDRPVRSRRDARRIVGENVVSFAHRYAYATFVSSDHYLNASLLLAQSLRSSGTIHDLVLLLAPPCNNISESHVLYDHYDEVVKLELSEVADRWNQQGKLSAWLLLDYAKVVYLEVDSLVLANVDHLFQLPEPAAAPRVFMPGKFSTGLLVLKPSNETYTLLVQSLRNIRAPLQSRNRWSLLNSFFDDWFQMPAGNRLPARYNVPVVFPKQFQVPSWFDVDRAYENLGPLMVVRYENANLTESTDLDSSSLPNDANAWCAARLRLFETLLKNDLLPLESDYLSNWAPVSLNSSEQISDSIWPPPPPQALLQTGALPSVRSKAREAFVTVLYGSRLPRFSVAGWAESFHHHHSFQSRGRTLLLVLSTLDPAEYREHVSYFDEVRVVEPIIVNGRAAQESFTLLHLWNQTDFDKLVYVAATSLFMENCHSLLDYSPFAAVPSLFPPDTFSTQTMCIQPNKQIYNLFREELVYYEYCTHPVERFLNAYYNDWYQKSTMHRISPLYMVSAVFESHFQNSALPGKVLSFDLDWLPDEEVNVTVLWKKIMCDLKPGRNPDVVISLCNAV